MSKTDADQGAHSDTRSHLPSANAVPSAASVYAGMITVEDIAPRDDFSDMVRLLLSAKPGSGSEALAMLRTSFPHVPLASRVAALEAARRS